MTGYHSTAELLVEAVIRQAHAKKSTTALIHLESMKSDDISNIGVWQRMNLPRKERAFQLV